MYAHYALHKLRILPSTLSKMSIREKAFIYGSISVKCEDSKKEMNRLKSSPHVGRRK